MIATVVNGQIKFAVNGTALTIVSPSVAPEVVCDVGCKLVSFNRDHFVARHVDSTLTSFCSQVYKSCNYEEMSEVERNLHAQKIYDSVKLNLFTDHDPQEASTIVYVCVPHNMIDGEKIYVHTNTDVTVYEAIGALAYANDLWIEDGIHDILQITIEDNLF